MSYDESGSPHKAKYLDVYTDKSISEEIANSRNAIFSLSSFPLRLILTQPLTAHSYHIYLETVNTYVHNENCHQETVNYTVGNIQDEDASGESDERPRYMHEAYRIQIYSL